MRKIFGLLFILFIYISAFESAFAEKPFKIITREQWGANEEYRYLDSQIWIDILEEENRKRKENNTYISDEDTILYLGLPDYNAEIEKYLSMFFSEQNKILKKIDEVNGRKLFWPIEQAEKIQGIVIHHTDWDYTDSYDSIREIYKFHTIDRKWGDIGYNFLISADGEIFEGRAGGETAVGAHIKWNNIGNIGISLMGDYSHEHIPEKQKEALIQLTSYLIEKYDININQKKYFHEQCKTSDCTKEIYSSLNFPIIAHRDYSDTLCPGEVGYEDFLKIRNDLLTKYYVPNINSEKLEKIFEKHTQDNLKKLLNTLIILKHKEINYKKKKIFEEIIIILKNYFIKKYGE